MKKPKILVVGSFVMDLIVSTPRFPNSGETVLGTAYSTASGGKGANQAVQAARLGADVSMVGCVGKDDFGRAMLQSVREAGVNTQYVQETTRASSAIGNVQLECAGGKTANRIIVVPGANMCITKEDVAFLRDEIRQYDMVILQYEIPMEINEVVAAYAHAQGVPVMLNTAPAAPTTDELLRNVAYISPNEHEAALLTGVSIQDEASARQAAQKLLARGVSNVVITWGSRGAIFANQENFFVSPCVRCDHVADPTAAGDSFVGAFCTAVCMGASYPEALQFANCTAHITVSRMGAQPSLPHLKEVVALMKEKGFNAARFEKMMEA